MGAKQFLGVGSGDSGAELGLTGHLVDAVQSVEATQVK